MRSHILFSYMPRRNGHILPLSPDPRASSDQMESLDPQANRQRRFALKGALIGAVRPKQIALRFAFRWNVWGRQGICRANAREALSKALRALRSAGMFGAVRAFATRMPERL